MSINWQAFWSSLLGTTIPGLAVSILLLWLNNRSTKPVESYKSELARRLTELQNQLANENAQATHWHQKRVAALVEIYDAFRPYLDFLRRELYVPGPPRESMDPYHDFRAALDKNLLFLDDDLQQFVNSLQGELLHFWNWAQEQPRGHGITGDEVQRRLD